MRETRQSTASHSAIAVQRAGDERAPPHRTQHLKLADGIELKAPGNEIADDLHHLGGALLGIVGIDEPEIRVLAGLRSYAGIWVMTA